MRVWIITLVAIMVLGLVYYTIRRDVIKLDGIQSELLTIIAPSDTRYAKHYTDSGFAEIHKGMTEQEVTNLVGEPLARWHPYKFTNFADKAHYIGLQYSESPSSTHYRLRQIYLDNGKVAEIISYYYLD